MEERSEGSFASAEASWGSSFVGSTGDWCQRVGGESGAAPCLGSLVNKQQTSQHSLKWGSRHGHLLMGRWHVHGLQALAGIGLLKR